MTYSVKEAAELLGIHKNSIRQYSTAFDEVLSSSASPEPGQARKFTERDLRIFAFAQTLFYSGKKTSEILTTLRGLAEDDPRLPTIEELEMQHLELFTDPFMDEGEIRAELIRQRYLRMREREKRLLGKPIDSYRVYTQELADVDPTKVQEIAAKQIQILSIYYEEVVNQSKRSFKTALRIAILGFVFILAAVIFYLV